MNLTIEQLLARRNRGATREPQQTVTGPTSPMEARVGAATAGMARIAPTDRPKPPPGVERPAPDIDADVAAAHVALSRQREFERKAVAYKARLAETTGGPEPTAPVRQGGAGVAGLFSPITGPLEALQQQVIRPAGVGIAAALNEPTTNSKVRQEYKQATEEFTKREGRAPSTDEQVTLLSDALHLLPGEAGFYENVAAAALPAPLGFTPVAAPVRAAARTGALREAAGRVPAVAEAADRAYQGSRLADQTGAIRLPGEPLPPAGAVPEAPGSPVLEPPLTAQPPGAPPRVEPPADVPPAQPPIEPPKPLVAAGAVPPEPPSPPPSFESARDKLIGLIKSAKPVREQTQALYHQRRSQQAAILAKTFEQGGGEGVLNKALSSLKGELPKAQFEPPAGLMTTEEATSLYNAIWTTPELRPFERIQTGTAFRQLFDVGAPPTRSSLALLERVFGKDFVDAVLSKRSLGQKVWEETLGALGIPRALKSSLDLSAPLRQGVLLVGQPKEFGGAFVDMFKAARSDDALKALDDAIRQHPQYDRLVDSDLYLAPLGRAATLTELEEAFTSRIAAKIPGVALSQRAYIGFLNSLRARTFYSYVAEWGELATPEQYKSLASFITKASGRGTLGALERAAPVVAQAFFSPRFLASRLQAPLALFADNPLAPVSVSRVAARNMVAFMGLGVGLLSMLKLSGVADVNLDPRSANFGKARLGNTRLDFFAGYLQLARFTAMMMTATGVTGATGRPYDANRLETLVRFMRSKAAPLPGFAANVLAGRDLAGDEVRWDGKGIFDQAGNLLSPMNVETVIEAVAEHGTAGALYGIPSTFGVGVSTYQAFASQVDIAVARRTVTALLYPRETSYGTLSDDQRARVDASPMVREAVRLQNTEKKAEKKAEPVRVPSAPTRQLVPVR